MAHIAAWQVGGQRLALRTLIVPARLGLGLQLLDLGGHGREVRVQGFVQQALLFSVERLGLGRELQPLEQRVLVRDLVDDGLLERDGLLRAAQRLAQLLFIQGVEVVGDHRA